MDITLLLQLEKLKSSILKNLISTFSTKRKSANYSKLVSLETQLQYRFSDFKHLEEALSHRSYTNTKGIDNINSNERLEFLGDAVLEIVVSEYLFRNYPKKNEGVLTKIRSHWVSKKVIFEIAKDINLGDYIYLSQAEIKMGGRNRKTILSDAYESILGAVYLDSGLESARKVINLTMLDKIDTLDVFNKFDNYKSELLEYVQAEKLGSLEYKLLETKGPDHRKVFQIMVIVDGAEYGIGSGFSKKVAEQDAAQKTLEIIRK